MRVISSAESTVHLRGLHHVAFPVYQAAFAQWAMDYLEICEELDDSGVWKQIEVYAKKELVGFSFAQHSEEIEKDLGLDRFVKEWRVPKEKYLHLWPYFDAAVKSTFFDSNESAPFKLLPVCKYLFSIIDDIERFEDWEHLKFNFKVMYATIAIGLGGVAAASVAGSPIGVAGIAIGAAALGAQVK